MCALAALAATASFAQSSVVLSGAVDVAYANKAVTAGDGSSIAKASGISEGQNTANRINFTMTEDLGGGMKAGAMVEQGLNITNGALTGTRAGAAGLNVVNVGSAAAEIPTGSFTTSVNRQSYVFANGGFGEIRAGFTRTNAYDLATFSGYLVGQEQYGSLLHTLAINNQFGGTRGNGLTWITPSMNGFKATVQYGAGGDGRESYSTDAAAGLNGVKDYSFKRTGLRLDYNNGPLNVAYALTSVSAKTVLGTPAPTTANTFNIYNGIASTTTPPSAADYKGKLNQLAASYEIGALKLTGHYLNGKKDNASVADVTYKAKVLGAIYTIGNVGLFGTVGNGSVQTDGVATKDNDYKQQQFGVRYSLSKRTVAYVMTGESKDNAAVNATNPATAVGKAKVTAFGMMHSF